MYRIYYENIHCAPVSRFPYMVHFYINEETEIVEVLAIISTCRNPKIWLEKITKK